MPNEWAVVVDDADTDANAELTKDTPFLTVEPGKQLVLINLTLTNGSARAGTVGGSTRFRLLNSHGAAVDTLTCALHQPPRRLDPFTQLEPGGTVSGSLCFAVDSGDADNSILVAEGPGGRGNSGPRYLSIT